MTARMPAARWIALWLLALLAGPTGARCADVPSPAAPPGEAPPLDSLATGSFWLADGPLPGSDGVIDEDDLVTLVARWGPCTTPCPPDVDGDGDVGPAELAAVLTAWGTPR